MEVKEKQSKDGDIGDFKSEFLRILTLHNWFGMVFHLFNYC